MTNNYTFSILLQKYLDGMLTAVEQEQFTGLLSDPSNLELLEQAMRDNYDNSEGGMGWDENRRQTFVHQMVRSIVNTPQTRKTPVMISRLRIWKVAAAVLLVSLSALLWLKQRQPAMQPIVKIVTAPGHDGAILTLADGRQLVLDSLSEGVVATENGTRAILKNGQLVYDGAKTASTLAFNTMHTPAGRQFSLVLPDGSKAWLNAASSIRYPLQFNGNERMVEVTGEVYFEVVHNKKEPFRVKAGKLTIEDIGTAFNVNAYTDEASINTTLIEGKVKVYEREHAVLLNPGQQAKYNEAAGAALAVVDNLNIEEITAWKNGLFHYENTEIKTILRQFARWYNIIVHYNGEVPPDKFFMMMKRNANLPEALKVLQTTGIQFRLEGQHLYVGKP